MPGPVPADLTPLTVELHRALQWARLETADELARAQYATVVGRRSPGAADREYWAAVEQLARGRAAWAHDLTVWLFDRLRERITDETRRRVEAEALAWLDRAA